MGHATASTAQFVGYHGTSSVHVPSIRVGIRPHAGLNFAGGSQLGEGFYVTHDAVTAQRFAEFAVITAGGVPIVLEVYARGFDQMQGAAVPAVEWWRISPRYITDFDYLTAPITSFEPATQIKFNSRAYGALEVR